MSAKNRKYLNYTRKASVNLTLGVSAVVMHKRECFRAVALKGISSIILVSFSSSVSVFEEVFEIMSWWGKKPPGIRVEFKLCWVYPLISFL